MGLQGRKSVAIDALFGRSHLPFQCPHHRTSSGMTNHQLMVNLSIETGLDCQSLARMIVHSMLPCDKGCHAYKGGFTMSDKKSNVDKTKEKDKKHNSDRTVADNCGCFHVVDACGCRVVDPCGCYVSQCCC